MEDIVVLAEIEKSQDLTVLPTAHEPSIWRYCIFATGSILPFMKDTYNRLPIRVTNILVDFKEYTKFEEIEQLRALNENEGGWVNKGAVLYVRFPHYFPPITFFSFKYGIYIGFTNNKPVLRNKLMFRSGLQNAPVVEQSADTFSYDKMKFNSASVTLDNSDGHFDNMSNYFGNEFNLLVGNVKDLDDETDNFFNLAQYYIANFILKLDNVTFQLKDKRERLSARIPNKVFTLNEFPFLDDNNVDKDMQEAYGHCFGVPGVCLQGKQIKARDGELAIEGNLSQYRFRFASKISRIDAIRVKMTAGSVGLEGGRPGETRQVDGWTTVYQRELPEGDKDQWVGWKLGISQGNITDYLYKGEITLSWDVVKRGGNYENEINEVVMDGVFIDDEYINGGTAQRISPLSIISHIMEKYSSVPYLNNWYYVNESGKKEIEEELGELNNTRPENEIGILFDKSITVYEAIERIQSGCIKGFQFHVYQNKFTARVDNPKRKIKGLINQTDILNLNEIEIDWNTEIYGSFTDIEYRHNYNDDTGWHYIDRTKERQILNLYRIEKAWGVNTLLANKEGAEEKSNIYLDDFQVMRPLIKGIKLGGLKWFKLLRVYDMWDIDFSVRGDDIERYPHHLVRLLEDIGLDRFISVKNQTKLDSEEHIAMISDKKYNLSKREFVGILRCQLIKVSPDTQTGEVTIDIRVREAV